MRDYSTGLVLRFTVEDALASDQEPERFLIKYKGELVLISEDSEVAEIIGSFFAIVINVQGAIVEDEYLFDIFDSEGTTLEYYDLYNFKRGYFKKAVTSAACELSIWNPNLLILDGLFVKPRHRGHGVGLLALKALIHRLGAGVGLVAMKPFPLECGSVHQYDPVAHAKATAKLRKYCSRVGFVRVPGTEFMVRSPGLPFPPVL